MKKIKIIDSILIFLAFYGFFLLNLSIFTEKYKEETGIVGFSILFVSLAIYLIKNWDEKL